MASILAGNLIDELELTKVKNRVESQIIFSETELLNKAMNLAYYELLGDAAMVNEEAAQYLKTSARDIQEQAQKIFIKENCSVLYYHALHHGDGHGHDGDGGDCCCYYCCCCCCCCQ